MMTARQRAAQAVLEVLAETPCRLDAAWSLSERIAVRDELLLVEAWLLARAADPPTTEDRGPTTRRRREVVIRNNAPVCSSAHVGTR